MNLVSVFYDLLGRDKIAEAPARHRERFGKTVDYHRSLAHALNRGDRNVAYVAVSKLGVNFVRNYHKVVFYDNGYEFFDFFAGHYRARGVVRERENQDFRPVGDCRFEPLGRKRKALFGDERNFARFTAHKRNVGGVADVAGRGNKHFVTGSYERTERHIDSLARADRGNDFVFGGVVEVEAIFKVRRNFATELDKSGVRSIRRFAVLNGLDRGFADFPRRDEIGFAHAQRNAVFHFGGYVEKFSYSADGHSHDAGIQFFFVIHGCTTSLSSSSDSNTTPSVLYFLRIK